MAFMHGGDIVHERSMLCGPVHGRGGWQHLQAFIIASYASFPMMDGTLTGGILQVGMMWLASHPRKGCNPTQQANLLAMGSGAGLKNVYLTRDGGSLSQCPVLHVRLIAFAVGIAIPFDVCTTTCCAC